MSQELARVNLVVRYLAWEGLVLPEGVADVIAAGEHAALDAAQERVLDVIDTNDGLGEVVPVAYEVAYCLLDAALTAVHADWSPIWRTQSLIVTADLLTALSWFAGHDERASLRALLARVEAS